MLNDIASLSADELEKLSKALNLYNSFFMLLILLCFASFIAVLVVLIHHVKNRKLLKDNRVFLSETISVQEEERHRISQELHDTISQNIKAILLKEKELLSDYRLNSEKDLCSSLNEIISMEKQNQTELRSIIQNLNIQSLKGVKFKNIINDLCLQFKQQSSINCILFIAPDVDLEQFDEEQRHHILRIIQEALNNAKIHANPTETSVVINKNEQNGKIHIMIFDDGQGFDTDKSDSTYNRQSAAHHFGLSGMEMRAKLLGGSLTTTSSRETGTEVCLEF